MTTRDRRALLLGGGAIFAALLVLRLVPLGVSRTLDAERALRDRAALLARARADLAEAPVLRDSAAVLSRALVGLAPKLLSGDTPAEAVADLSGRLNLAASRHGARLERTDEVADSTTSGRLRRIKVRAALESDIRGVTAFLRAVELGNAVLSVEELRIVAPEPGSSERVPEVLRVEVTVAGWFLGTRATRDGKRET